MQIFHYCEPHLKNLLITKEKNKMKRLFLILCILLTTLVTTTSANANNVCLDTGVEGLTAHYINEVPSGPLDVTCDIGVFYNHNGAIKSADIRGTIAGAKSKQFGIYVYGANVDVSFSTISGELGYPHQFVPLGFFNGATGTIKNNQITGVHRAGMLIRGAGTVATIKGNTITGTGPKLSGWAENGIQIDQGATATVVDNVINDHWWNTDDWVSTGLGIYSSGVTAQRNTLMNNDLGVYLVGDSNNFVNNEVLITYGSVDVNDIYGVFIYGNDNGVRQSNIFSSTGTGLGLGVMGTNNKLIKNSVSGWGENVWDGGDETKWPKPFRD